MIGHFTLGSTKTPETSIKSNRTVAFLALAQQKIQFYSESNFIQARLRKNNACPTVKLSHFPAPVRWPRANRAAAELKKKVNFPICCAISAVDKSALGVDIKQRSSHGGIKVPLLLIPI